MFRINRSLTSKEVLQSVYTRHAKSRRQFSKKLAKLQNTEPLLKKYQSHRLVQQSKLFPNGCFPHAQRYSHDFRSIINLNNQVISSPKPYHFPWITLQSSTIGYFELPPLFQTILLKSLVRSSEQDPILAVFIFCKHKRPRHCHYPRNLIERDPRITQQFEAVAFCSRKETLSCEST